MVRGGQVDAGTLPVRSRAMASTDTGSAPSLRRLIDHLDPGLLTPLGSDGRHPGFDVSIAGPTLHAPGEELLIQPGAVVLAVGTDPTSAAALEEVRRAGAQRAGAVVFQVAEGADGAALAPLLDEAASAGIVLLAVRPDMAWGQLYRLLRAAASRTGCVLEAGWTSVPAGDLFALANAIAAMVGGPVTIEDPQSQVLAYSSLDEPIDEFRRGAILRRGVSKRWVQRLSDAGIFKEIWSGDKVVRVEQFTELGMRPRLAVAIWAGSEALGSIWVAQGHQPFGPEAERALADAARLAALHLLSYRAAAHIELQARSGYFEALLEGRGPMEISAERLGLDPATPVVVVAFEVTSQGPNSDRVQSVLAGYWESFRRRAVCSALDQAMYALVPLVPALPRSRLLSMTSDLVGHVADAVGVELRAGVGAPANSLDAIPRSRREADRALQTLSRNGLDYRSQVVGIESVRSQVLLDDLCRLIQATPKLRMGGVEALLAHDAAHDTAYAATLTAFLDAFGDMTRAAEGMQVHPKTFRYRLRRAMALSDLDVNDPVERLVTHLQLRASQSMGPTT